MILPPPLLSTFFFDTRKFLKHRSEGFLYEIFRHCETKNFRRKILRPPIMHKIFRYPNFSETMEGCPRYFSALWDKKFLTQNHDTPSPPPLSTNFFGTRNFLKHRSEGLLYEIFRHCETKKLDTKLWYSSLNHKVFRYPKLVTHWRVPLRNFSALWDIKISTENRDMPPPIHKLFSIPEIFWKTEGFLYKAFRFGLVRQKISTKPWCPPPLRCMKFYDKKIFLNTKVFSNEMFWYSETKPFRRKIVMPPSLLSIKIFFLPEFFCNTEWFPGELFSVLWDKKNFRQNREASPLLCLKIFNSRVLSKHRSVLLRILCALWDKNFSTEFSDIPFLCIKFCDTRNFLKHRTSPQRNFLVLWDKKFWKKSRDTPSFP